MILSNSLNRAIFAAVFTVSFLLSNLVVISPTFGVSAGLYPAAILVIIPTFLFTFAPWFRLAGPGEYLRQGGIDNIATRGSFQMRDVGGFVAAVALGIVLAMIALVVAVS